MKILIINSHLNYPGWSEGKLNLAFMDLAKEFFIERGHQVAEMGRSPTSRYWETDCLKAL